MAVALLVMGTLQVVAGEAAAAAPGCSISGTSGADRLVGTRHRDGLCGRAGDDRLGGRGGNDRLKGGPGDDRLVGGSGKDLLVGGAGDDVLAGGRGNDRVNGRDGSRFSDVLRCGPGERDKAFADPGDVVAKSCEVVVQNDPPTAVTLSPSDVDENEPAGTEVGVLSASDPDSGDTHEFALVDGAGDEDNPSFAIAGDILETTAALDFEAASQLSIRVAATDERGATVEQTLTVSVNDVAEGGAAPVIAAIESAPLAYTENDGATAVTATGTISDTDSADFAGGMLTVDLASGGQAEDRLAVAGGTSIGTVTGGTGTTPLVITLNSGATPAATQALLRSITYRNVSDAPSTTARTVRFVLSDGDGGSSAPVTRGVTVTAVDDAPIAVNDSATLPQGAPATGLAVLANDTDVDAGPKTIVSASDPGHGTVVLTGGSAGAHTGLTYQPDGGYCNTTTGGADSFTYTLNGGSTATVFLTVTCPSGPTNQAPTNINLSAASVAENQPVNTTVGALSAVDPDAGDSHTFTLVAGVGDSDNASFTINGTALRTSAVFDFETKTSYSIRVRVTDQGGLSFEKQFAITVTDVAEGGNQAPTNLNLSPASVAENQPVNTTVGTLSAVDPNAGDTHTYTLVAGAGDSDNGAFNISGTALRTSAVFDFETKSSFSVRVRATDQGGLTFEKAFTITVTNANETPTDINLSATTVAENLAVNTTVGVLGAVDPDAGNTHTFSLVAGTGDGDNASFNISGTNLRTSAVFDFETKASYSIRIRATDQGGLSFEKQFTITVSDAAENAAPTDISLSPLNVAENQPMNTTIGTLTATDPDAGNTHTFSLVTGTGDGDNGSFTVVGNTLRTSAVFDFETKSSYSVRVRATDQGGLSFEKAFTITVTDVNEAPANVTLSSASVAENQPVNTSVGTLAAVDPDAGNTHTFTLVAGAGDGDNASFNIAGSSLRTSAVFDFETKASYSVRVRATDQGGLTFEKAFTITVTDVNEGGGNQAPTNITLSSASVAENQPANTSVGTLAAVDPDAGNTHTFTLVAGAGDGDNASFNISGSSLRTSAVFDFETKSSYSVRVRATDQGGLSFEKAFTITVTDANEAPANVTLSSASVAENQPVNTSVGTLAAVDPDTGNTHTFTLVAGTGDGDNASFNIAGSSLRTSAVFDFETKASYSVRVRATDQGGLTFEKAFTVTVTDVNEATAAPVVTLDIGSGTYAEGAAAILISPALTVTDADSANLQGATISLSPFEPGMVLALDTTPGAITQSYNSATGVLTVSGSGTVAQYQTALRSVRFSSAADSFANPSTAVTFTATDGTNTSVPKNRTITLTNVNDAPVLAAVEGGTVAYTEQGTAVALTSALTVTDPDDTNIESGQVRITAGFQAGDELVFTNQNGITGSYATGTGVLTLTGTATLANYQAALRSITFRNLTADAPTATRTIEFRVNDGTANSNLPTRGIAVTAVNDPPVITTPGTQSGTEDVAKVFTMSVADPDATTLRVSFIATNGTVTLSGTAGLTVNSGANGTSLLTVTGGVAALNTALTGMSFKGGANYNTLWAGDSSLAINVQDQGSTGSGGNLSDDDFIDFPLAAVNDVPVAATQNIGTVHTNIGVNDVGTLLAGATDPDSSDPGYVASFSIVTVTTTGGDCTGCEISDVKAAGSFDLNPGPGLTGARSLRYTISDGGSPVGPAATSAPATINLAISGPVIWFVDDSAAAGGNGTLVKPFQAISGVAGAANDADDVDGTGSNVFVFSGGYAAGLTLNATERLIGQGVTGTTFDTLFGISPPAASVARPTLNGTRPVISSGVTYGGNGGVVRGLSITPASGTMGLVAAGRTGLTAGEVTVTTTNATAVSLTSTDGGFAFTAVNANGGASGIIWTNTIASTGSLTVSGGTIQNTTGPGVSLTNARQVALDQVTMLGTDRSGVQGVGVDGFSFTNGSITNAGDTHANDNDSSIAFNTTAGGQNDNVHGAVTITNSTLKDAYGGGIDIFNYAGTITNATITGNTISSPASNALSRRDGIAMNLFGSATTVASLTRATISNNTITGFPSGGGITIQGGNSNSSTAPIGTYGVPGSTTGDVLTITGNSIAGDATTRLNGWGIGVGFAGRAQGNAVINNNGTAASPLRNMKGSGIAIGAAGDVTAYFVVNNNVISPNSTGFGSDALALGTDKNIQADLNTLTHPFVRATITNNTVSNSDGSGIGVLHRDSNGTLDLKLEDNTIVNPGDAGIRINGGSSGNASFNPTTCASIDDNVAPAGHVDGFGDTPPGMILTKRGLSATPYKFGIVGLTPSPANPTTTENFVEANNTVGTGGGFYAGEQVFVQSTGDNFTSCTLPAGM